MIGDPSLVNDACDEELAIERTWSIQAYVVGGGG